MLEWSLFSYCWIGIIAQLIASDLLVGHPGGQLAVSVVLVTLLTALVAHRRGVSGVAEWWWLLVGTVVNWLLLLPVGALGSTSSLTAILSLPSGLLRNLILYHTEEDTLAQRRARYTEEAATVFSGAIHVPDDLEIIELG